VDYISQNLDNIQYQLANHPVMLDNSLFYDVFGHEGSHLGQVSSLCTAINSIITCNTLERRYNEVPRDWQNVLVKMGVRYIRVLFHTLNCYWAEEYNLLYQGLCYIMVHYIRVPLYIKQKITCYLKILIHWRDTWSKVFRQNFRCLWSPWHTSKFLR